MTRSNPYWTDKHWSRTNAEVIRTITSVISAAFNMLAAGHFFGWW